MKKLLSILLACIILSSSTVYATESERDDRVNPGIDYNSLNVPVVIQHSDINKYACWAASGASVTQFHGYGYTKEGFAHLAQKEMNKTQTMSVMKSTLAKLNISSTIQSSKLTYSKYKSEIDSGRTMVLKVSGHAVVADGYNNTMNEQVIGMMDPWFYNDDVWVSIPYGKLTTTASDNKYFYYWKETLYNIY